MTANNCAAGSAEGAGTPHAQRLGGVTDEGLLDVIDQQIVKLYIVRRLPQLDAAAEIGVDRKTISRRLPHIYNIARRLVGKTDKEKAP